MDSNAENRLCDHRGRMACTVEILDGAPSTNVQVRVVQDKINVAWKTVDAEIWWDVMDACQGWKLEKNIVTYHYRILNPEKKRVAWGDEKAMRLSFKKIKAQLEK